MFFLFFILFYFIHILAKNLTAVNSGIVEYFSFSADKADKCQSKIKIY